MYKIPILQGPVEWYYQRTHLEAIYTCIYIYNNDNDDDNNNNNINTNNNSDNDNDNKNDSKSKNSCALSCVLFFKF